MRSGKKIDRLLKEWKERLYIDFYDKRMQDSLDLKYPDYGILGPNYNRCPSLVQISSNFLLI